MDTVLQCFNVKGGYKLSDVYIDAVSGVSLAFRRNEVVGIAGESGCGKSTLIKILYGYVEPPLTLRDGTVELYTNEGRKIEISSLSVDELRRDVWWKHVSYIPQNAMNVLNPTIRIRDHFAEIYREHVGLEKREAYAKAREYVENFGLPSDVLSAFPHQLSGGMKQRIVSALSLLLKPDVVLADEPTSALDVINQRVVLIFLKKAQRLLKNTLILVSHDMGIQSVLTDRMAVMYAGKIVEVGETPTIFEAPMHPYTKVMIESLPRLGDKAERKGVKGQPPDLRNPPPGCRFHPRCPYSTQMCCEKEPKLVEVEPGHYVSCWLVG